MGLINAALGAAGSTLADQWKEYFYCEAMDKEVLLTKGVKKTGTTNTFFGGSNSKGSDNIITNGSGIAVADGQAMIIVDDGEVVEFCAEPGRFVWDASSEPSIFTGNLWQSIKDTFKLIGKRFSYGGETGHDQRIYYFNTKELIDNKFGTPNPIPFRVVDSKIGVDLDVSLRCAGVFSYRIADPLLFYSKVCGNVPREYRRDQLENQLKSEFVSALQPALAKLSDLEIRPNQIIQHNTKVEDAMNEALDEKWGKLRGLEVVSVAFSTVTLPEEDQERLKQLQTAATLSNAAMGAGFMTASVGQALNSAAENENGAMAGLMGMGMTMNTAGSQISNMYAMGQQSAPVMQQAPAAGGWTCPQCGAAAGGNFCSQCGTPKPIPQTGWTCSRCGAVSNGNFCSQCGERKPE